MTRVISDRGIREVAADQHADALRGRARPDADEHRAVAEHEDVAAGARRGVVLHVVVAVVEVQARRREQRVVVEDRPRVDQLALTRGHRHGVHREPGVRERDVVALEQRVGQRREHEVVGLEVVPQQRRPGGQRQVALEDAADQRLGEGRAVEALEQLAQRLDELRADRVHVGGAVEDEVAPLRGVEHLREQRAEQVHRHALVAQLGDERVVLLAGPLRPHHVVEEQLVDVGGGEAGELEPGTVHHHLAQLTDLGVDVQRGGARHGHGASWCSGLVSIVALHGPGGGANGQAGAAVDRSVAGERLRPREPDSLLQPGDVVGAVVAAPVDEERRRAARPRSRRRSRRRRPRRAACSWRRSASSKRSTSSPSSSA